MGFLAISDHVSDFDDFSATLRGSFSINFDRRVINRMSMDSSHAPLKNVYSRFRSEFVRDYEIMVFLSKNMKKGQSEFRNP